jgi:hypothetical protein
MIGQLSPAFAQAAAGQSSAADWWARSFSAIAILISVAAFLAGRLDKWRESSAAAQAKLPLVDLHVEKGDIAGNWDFQVRTKNRSDVSIEFVSIDVGPDFQLRSDDAKDNNWTGRLAVDLLKIEPGESDTVDGDIHGRLLGSQKIRFKLEYRIFEATPRTVNMEIERNI